MKCTWVTTTILILIALTGSGQIANTPAFRAVSPPEGFTFSAVITITQDPLGMIWFGTQHGLYSYDTRNFTKYSFSNDNPATIMGNNIRNLYCDSSGKMWVSTNAGLCYYDFQQERFFRIYYTDNDGNRINRNTYRVLEDEANQLWVIDNRGLAQMDTVNKTLDYKEFDIPVSGLNYGRIAKDGTMWLGSTNGSVYVSHFPFDELTLFGRFRQAAVQCILPADEQVWIAYDWNGVVKTDETGNMLAQYNQLSESESTTISHNRVRDIYMDKTGKVWLATYRGLSIIDGDHITNYKTENYPGINHSSLYTFFEDLHDGLWVGTWSGGLYYRNLNDNNFVHIKDNLNPTQNTNVISSFVQGRNGKIWVGTESGLLFSFDAATLRYSRNAEVQPGPQVNNIKSLYKDTRGNIWLGTFSAGIWINGAGENQFRQLPYLVNNRTGVYAFAQEDDKMWIATFGNGLHAYNTLTGETEHFMPRQGDTTSLSNALVRSILLDRHGNLWVGTMNGLNLRMSGTTGFRRFTARNTYDPSTINHNEIFYIQEDREGNIWIGTGGGGLNRYNPSTEKFEYYTVESGLGGREIYGILQDQTGNIWVSTENGISSFDPRTKLSRNFSREDGLQGRQFNPGSCFLSDNGVMFFGGSNGFNSFSPSNIKTNPLPPKTLLTSIFVNHDELRPGLPNSPLQTSLKFTDRIVLGARQNSLTLNFIANNYLQPQKNSFRYRLLNYENNWIEAGSDGKATFTKMPPGKYTFELLASNNDGIWSAEPRRLQIVIRYPLLLRWYAITGYVLILILVAYYIEREISIRQSLRNQVRKERTKRENEEKLSQLKMRFLTNITHEFKTPLTLIQSPAQQLLDKYSDDKEARFLLDILDRNTTRLQWLINQLLDLRKIDMGKMEANKKPVNVVRLCHVVEDYFLSYAKDKNINLSVKADLTEIFLLTDNDKMDIIITNLVSNALKFTPEGGIVTIRVEQMTDPCSIPFHWQFGEKITGNAVTFTVKDTGPGMKQEEIPTMFELFTQGKGHEAAGTGIGLAIVREYVRLLGGFIGVNSDEKGTSILVCFPWKDTNPLDYDETEEAGTITDYHTLTDYVPESDIPAGSDPVKLLLVEDDTDTRNYLMTVLRKYFSVITAVNGKQGFEKALVTRPDVIVADVIMPISDGIEMNRLLKENPATRDIPVIVISAQTDPATEIESLESGAEAFISKPFSDELLLAHIRKLLSKRDLSRQVKTWDKEQGTIPDDSDLADATPLDKIIRIIEKSMHRPDFGVDTLASHLNMSRTSLYRKLKTMTGQSATEFIRYVRLKKALALMEGGVLSIEEVSMTVGFSSHSYFSHCFRQQFGKTPSEFVQSQKKSAESDSRNPSA